MKESRLMTKRKHFSLFALFVVNGGICSSISVGQDPVDFSKQFKDSVTRFRDSKPKVDGNPSITERVRKTTWRLMTGELAAIKSNGLSSTSFDALKTGLDELDTIFNDLEKSPDTERELAQNIQLAMRLDAMNARRTEMEATKNISRTEELARLSQLREINRSYRDLLQQLLASQTQLMAGQIEEGVKNGKEATQNLAKIDQIASIRRDFYLFDDEPSIDGSTKDFQLIQKVALPYSNQVRQHHQALLSLATLRSATREATPSREALEFALEQANAALSDLKQPNLIALYARGLIYLELGKLIKQKELFSDEAENLAKPFFDKSQDSLKQSKAGLPANLKLNSMLAEIDSRLEEASGPKAFLSQSLSSETQGNSKEAIRVVFQGLLRHRDKNLALQWIDLNWRFGEMDYSQALNELTLLENSKLSSDIDPAFLNLRARIKVLQVWRQLSTFPIGNGVEGKQGELIKILNEAKKDLAKSADQNEAQPNLKWHKESLVALTNASLILLEPDKNLDVAKASLARIPVIVNELEALMPNASVVDRNRLNESIHYSRMAEGYLALRILPEYQDRSRAAFAAAADAASRIPGGTSSLQINGGAFLRALLSRPDSTTGSRIAQEERQLRGSLQQMLPALISVQLAEPNMVAASLTKSFGNMRISEPAWDPRKQLDPTDVIGARNSVLSDTRSVTALALISAQQPKLALKQFLAEWLPDADTDQFSKIDWNVIWQKAKLISDPLSLMAFGRTIEECAVNNVKEQDPLRQVLLSHSLASYEQADKMVKETTIWRERWPYLEGLISDSRARLLNEDYSIQKAENLRKQMQLTEARKILQDARERHLKSVPIREKLILTLLDESQMNTQQSIELQSKALNQLVDARKNGLQLSVGALLQLAELQEQSGKTQEAVVVYNEVFKKAEKDSADHIRARSRMAVLLARSAD